MSSSHLAYQQILTQKHSTLKRLAAKICCNEIRDSYDAMLRARHGVLSSQKEPFHPVAQEEFCTALCSILPQFLSGLMDELLHAVIHTAVDDIESKEEPLFETIGLDVLDIPKRKIERIAKSFSRSAISDYSVRFSARTMEVALSEIKRLSGMQEQSNADLIKKINGMLPNLMRIIFTETCSTYNFTQLLCYSALAELNQDLMIRWCERINDATGDALHASVSADSKALHGQIVRPKEQFSSDGGGWFHPPNRPYDHAVLMPWHPVFEQIFVWKHKQGKPDGH